MEKRTARSVIALTGGVGSGKSTVAELLVQQGADIIDADILAREAVSPNSLGHRQVVEAFPNALNHDRSDINRKKLAEIVFASKTERTKLEDILHPIINRLYHEKLKKLQLEGKTTPIVYVIPLFFESRFKYPEIKKVVVVSAKREICIERIMKREGLSREDATLRVDAQLALTEKEKLADTVIYNNGTLQALSQDPELKKLLSLY